MKLNIKSFFSVPKLINNAEYIYNANTIMNIFLISDTMPSPGLYLPHPAVSSVTLVRTRPVWISEKAQYYNTTRFNALHYDRGRELLQRKKVLKSSFQKSSQTANHKTTSINYKSKM